MIVIADDITGAAEIAGIAFCQGLRVRLVCAGSYCGTPSAGVTSDGTTVIATDTRSLTEAEAAAETRRIAATLPVGLHLFKKTDSALRGHVVAELSTLMQTAGYRRAVYLPANPSKDRIIRNGIYYIKGVPIHETAFSYDPEFPARTSSMKERFPDAAAHGIIMPDAESMDDIRRVIAHYDDGQTLFAGGADLMKTMQTLPRPRPVREVNKYLQAPNDHSTGPEESLLRLLILCGSTQSRRLDLGIPIAPMPREVYDGEEGADYWYNALTTHHSLCTSHHSPLGNLILTIPYTHRTGKEVAIHLRTVMAEMAKRLINEHFTPHSPCEGPGESGLHLIIEGGATAWATLQALGWTAFTIECQIAPGVVQMRADNGTLITLKPGSYPWGGLFSGER